MVREYEEAMWEAAYQRNVSKFGEIVSSDAVMVCGGYRCTGAEYTALIKDFNIAGYKMSDYEEISVTDTTVQNHYIIETFPASEQDKDLAGKFNVTSTWTNKNGKWQLIFNMDSRLFM